MGQVIVSIRQHNNIQGKDFEVPSAMTAGALILALSQALGWEKNSEILALPEERILPATQSLEDAEIWDGAWLIIQPVGTGIPRPSAQTTQPTISPPSTGGPVKGWRAIDNLPSASQPESQKPPSPSGGYIWKRIDKDDEKGGE